MHQFYLFQNIFTQIMNTIFKLNYTKLSNYASSQLWTAVLSNSIRRRPIINVRTPTMKDEKGVRNPFPWTRHHGQTTRPRVFSGFPVTMSEIAAEMRVKGGGVVTYQSRRWGHRHKGERRWRAVRLIGVTGWKINGLVAWPGPGIVRKV